MGFLWVRQVFIAFSEVGRQPQDCDTSLFNWGRRQPRHPITALGNWPLLLWLLPSLGCLVMHCL